MQDLIDDFCRKMDIKNFSNNTKKSYRLELRKYLNYCNTNKREYNSNSFQDFLSSLINVNKLSECSLKQSIGATKFFLNSFLTFHTN